MFTLDSESVSGILGWVSISCWVVVYSPQIYENYSLKSGEGLSVPFVIIWLLGDLFNLVGAIIAGLLDTMILLALYYTLCDLVLYFQIYYYRYQNRPVQLAQSPNGIPVLADQEDTPLLAVKNGVSKDTRSTVIFLFRYLMVVTLVISSGVLAWWISLRFKIEKPPPRPEESTRWLVQIMGWSSAVLYLGARIPQISKNIQTRCEGLSPALFLFAILGNATYALSIWAASTGTRQYWVTNASWIAGSALTIILDIIVLCQFLYFQATDHVVSLATSAP